MLNDDNGFVGGSDTADKLEDNFNVSDESEEESEEVSEDESEEVSEEESEEVSEDESEEESEEVSEDISDEEIKSENEISRSSSDDSESVSLYDNRGVEQSTVIPDDFYTTGQIALYYNSFCLSLILGILIFLCFAKGLKNER